MHRRVLLNSENSELLTNMKSLMDLSVQDEEVLENLLKFCSCFISKNRKDHIELICKRLRLLEKMTDAMKVTKSDEVRATVCLILSNLCLEDDAIVA